MVASPSPIVESLPFSFHQKQSCPPRAGTSGEQRAGRLSPWRTRFIPVGIFPNFSGSPVNQQLRLLVGSDPAGNTNHLLLCVSSDSCLETPGTFLFIRSYNPVPAGLILTLPLANQGKRHPYACKIARYDFFPENAPAHGSRHKQGIREFSLQVGELFTSFFLYVAGSPLSEHVLIFHSDAWTPTTCSHF